MTASQPGDGERKKRSRDGPGKWERRADMYNRIVFGAPALAAYHGGRNLLSRPNTFADRLCERTASVITAPVAIGAIVRNSVRGRAHNRGTSFSGASREKTARSSGPGGAERKTSDRSRPDPKPRPQAQTREPRQKREQERSR